MDYLVFKMPVAALVDMVAKDEINGTSMYNSVRKTVLYSYRNDKLSAKQLMDEDKKYGYMTTKEEDVYVRDKDLRELASTLAREIILDGYKGDVEKELLKRMLQAEIIYVINKNGGLTSTLISSMRSDCPVVDEKDMKDILDNAVFDTYDNGKMHIHSITIGYRYLWYNKDIYENITKAVKKAIQHELTYCLRKGKSIVPDEYLHKENGVRLWQEHKRSSNSNNSMEKRMVRNMVNQKRADVEQALFDVMCALSAHDGWTIPQLEVDGKWNKQKRVKLTSVVLSGKTQQEVLTLTDEDILTLAKDYWKGQFRIATAAIDKVDQITRH